MSSKVTNGVKQGGVLSPLLFTVYIDELLLGLKNSSYGCHIGHIFCGALGYADDVVLLAPTASALRKMLHICEEYSSKYNVTFNTSKTKLIVCTPDQSHYHPDIKLEGQSIDETKSEKHLGYPIGNITQGEIMQQAINDFLIKVNMVKSHFKLLPHDIMYNLLKTYCMPLYGSPLWDYSAKEVDRFYTTWRKAIRNILYLPNTTYKNLLHLICSDIPVKEQLYLHFISFYRNLINSENILTNLCARLAEAGSGSCVSNSVTVIAEHVKIARHHLCKYQHNYENLTDEGDTQVTASIIRDLLYIRYMYLFVPPDTFLLNLDECKFAIYSLCTI